MNVSHWTMLMVISPYVLWRSRTHSRDTQIYHWLTILAGKVHLGQRSVWRDELYVLIFSQNKPWTWVSTLFVLVGTLTSAARPCPLLIVLHLRPATSDCVMLCTFMPTAIHLGWCLSDSQIDCALCVRNTKFRVCWADPAWSKGRVLSSLALKRLFPMPLAIN